MSTLPDSASIWVVRSPDGERVCTREGDRFLPARTPWLREHVSLLILFAENDFRARYRAQALGVVWSLLQPLVMMGILSLVFTRAFHSTEPHFPVFLLIGLLAWQWIAASLNAATLAFVLQADMVKRTIFPRALLPISAVLSYGMNAAVETLVLLALIPFFPGAFHVSWALLAIPVAGRSASASCSRARRSRSPCSTSSTATSLISSRPVSCSSTGSRRSSIRRRSCPSAGARSSRGTRSAAS